MASYLVTGVSRGLGFEFLKQLSNNSDNTVFGLVRDKAATDKKVKSELGERANVHILAADITNYDAVKKSADHVAKVTGGKLDYLIANAAYQSEVRASAGIGDFTDQPELLEKDLLDSFNINVVGNIHLINLYLPLILKGTTKKVIAISTGMADIDFIAKFGVTIGSPYAISKAAMNAAVAKFSAQYAGQGVLFLNISPGLVNTRPFDNPTEEQKQGAAIMLARFRDYAPHFTGPITPTESVNHVMSVINKASVENGDGGSFVSHFGNKQWL
ncbi:NAD(P)-binding protein [Eremomyces bilateralis CBS 781.70]|uniref:NAD(P)-binding protein n=1 Tax=Eremomyces bilateralis CBS 781.70 TaxID=1392243 RepID=A0A6G1GFI2_9PEZI|nr:NAD(P)-binding protein [Eremomyces bilateralis CBS 781.70]KAF1816828.1 NAD(P)-binding protein [Eremomyces bilateralis CBS 781.70]